MSSNGNNARAAGLWTGRRAGLRVLALRRGLSAAQQQALGDIWAAFCFSRGVVWLVGVAVAAAVGVQGGHVDDLDPLSITAPFGSGVANLLVAPGARFDSTWLLEITQTGYDAAGTPAFFPLYPALVALLGSLVGSSLVAGIVFSCGCSLVGLYLLHRLTSLDHDREVARSTVWITACFPVAFAFSAVYTEGLFLLLSVGGFYAARLGRWNVAAIAALLAAATRSAGVLLVVPLVVLYLDGPRADREPDRPRHGLQPRYRVRRDALWLLTPPLGLLAFLAYLGLAIGDPLATFGAQAEWDRIVAPLAGLAMGVADGLQSLLHLFGGVGPGAAPAAGGDPEAMAVLNLALLCFLVLSGWLVREAARRLPAAYTSYALASLALPLSTPAIGQPLMSLPRFLMVIFPLWIALALWARERAAMRRVLSGLLVLLIAATALFVAWVSAP